ncbi:MAG: PAS domain S-box protein [Cyanobacteria bacterium P01_A01_bin.45]
MLKLPSPIAVVDFQPPNVTKEASVFDAIALMKQRKSQFDVVFILESKHPIGLLTNSDIVDLIVDGNNLRTLKVSEVMQSITNSIKLSDIHDVQYLLSLLNKNNSGLLPVVDEQENLIGVISAKNFCSYLNSNLELAARVDSQADIAMEMNQRLVEEVSKRDFLEEELQRSQQILQKVIDIIPQCIFWKDINSEYLGCNQRFAKDIGLDSCDQIISKTDCELEFIKEEVIHHSSSDTRIIENNQSENYIFETQNHSHSEQIRLNISKIPLHNSQGDVTGILCCYEDITKHRVAEESLLRFHKTIENINDSILITDAHSKIIYLNKAFTELLGYSCEELNKMGGAITIFNSKVAAMKIFNHLQEGKSLRERARVNHLSGRSIDVELQADAIKDYNGKYIGDIIIFTDISEKIRIEKELALHKKAVATSTDGIIIADATLPNTPIIYANSGFERITGYAVNEAIGKHRDFFLTNYTTAKEQNDIESAVKEAMKRTVIMSSYRKDRSKYITSLNVCCVYDYRGVLTNYIMINSDITEVKNLEKQLRKALKAEKDINKLKSDFITMASHEFRTPLSTILSSSELLENYHHKWDEEKKNKHFVRIQKSVKHMTNMLEDVLTFSKAESKELRGNLAHLELVEYCTNLVKEIQLNHNYHQKMVNIEFHTQLTKLQTNIDQHLLNIILSNILSNAIKYSNSEGTVSLILTVQNDIVVFIIKDEGIGIDTKELPLLFNSFYRASNIGNIPGTGLGLAIVKECIEACKGTIDVDSKIGQGTQFIINLPLLNHEREINNNRGNYGKNFID